MSGDVQPRKRKDKRRKKDELSLDELHSTSAVFGEGDVFMHSYHDHGTGGHWCAKIIFFSLLAILITLIGLIILENRGLSELEANSVESRYSGVLEGWLEDAPEDDHHDEHTLDLKHHDADEHADDDDDEPNLEVEKIEKEVIEDPVSTELPALPEDDDEDNTYGISRENGVDDDEEIEFLEPGDDDEPSIVEPVTAPPGKPFVEVDEDSSTVRPPGPDSLTEEEEYEKRQEELRREKEQASQMWLKLIVGGALLLATHAVVRRATISPDVSKEEVSRKESTASTDRYMSLIPEESSTPVSEVSDPEPPLQVTNETFKRIPFITKSAPTPKQTSEEDDNYDQDIEETEASVKEIEDKELYSDDEEVEEEEVVEEKKEAENEPADVETEEDIGDEVEIIDHEQLEEEEESVEEDEEDISDVDDAELLNRLEAKYGRLPEPERPGQKYKDGGQSVDETWPGEPSDAYWRAELDKAEDEFNQDWLE